MEPDPEYAVVWARYAGRCVICLGEARAVHELEPRSQAPRTWQDPDNRVTLCREHHDWVHAQGTRATAPYLRERAAILAAFVTP